MNLPTIEDVADVRRRLNELQASRLVEFLHMRRQLRALLDPKHEDYNFRATDEERLHAARVIVGSVR